MITSLRNIALLDQTSPPPLLGCKVVCGLSIQWFVPAHGHIQLRPVPPLHVLAQTRGSLLHTPQAVRCDQLQTL